MKAFRGYAPTPPVSLQFGKNYKIGPEERLRVRTPDSVTYINNILFNVTVKNKLINLLFVSNRIFAILFSLGISNVFSRPHYMVALLVKANIVKVQLALNRKLHYTDVFQTEYITKASSAAKILFGRGGGGQFNNL